MSDAFSAIIIVAVAFIVTREGVRQRATRSIGAAGGLVAEADR